MGNCSSTGNRPQDTDNGNQETNMDSSNLSSTRDPSFNPNVNTPNSTADTPNEQKMNLNDGTTSPLLPCFLYPSALPLW